MCAILGIQGIENVAIELINGGIALQHRGQDSCGITTYGEKFHTKKGFGLVQKVFNEAHIKRLKGNSGIIHLRYATVGSGDEEDIQPFSSDSFLLLSMGYNGNLTNFTRLKEEYGTIGSGCDVEAIQKVLHTEMVTRNLESEVASGLTRLPGSALFNGGMEEAMHSLDIPHNVNLSADNAIDHLFESITKVLKVCSGSYSVISHIPGLGMFGFRDSYGIKPLVIGKKTTSNGIAFAFSSETVAFQMPLGFDFIKDVDAGSVFLATEDGRIIERQLVESTNAYPCVFELIYFASPCSVINGISVSEFRYQLGKYLGEDYLTANLPTGDNVVCCGIPSAPERGAYGFSEITEIAKRDVLVRNNYLKRGFILPDREAREYNAMLKMPIDFSALGNAEYLVLVDDSIVRGDTTKSIIHRIKTEAKKRSLPLKEVIIVSLSPENKYPCVYGIDMAVDKELIAGKLDSVEEVRDYIGADRLLYQQIERLMQVRKKLLKGNSGGCSHCDACFSGNYPTGLTPKDIERIKQERLSDKGSDY